MQGLDHPGLGPKARNFVSSGDMTETVMVCHAPSHIFWEQNNEGQTGALCLFKLMILLKHLFANGTKCVMVTRTLYQDMSTKFVFNSRKCLGNMTFFVMYVSFVFELWVKPDGLRWLAVKNRKRERGLVRRTVDMSHCSYLIFLCSSIFAWTGSVPGTMSQAISNFYFDCEEWRWIFE